MELYLDPIQPQPRTYKGTFSKGHIPWNKAKRLLNWANKTSFCKGHKPHNTKYDGYISIRHTHERPYKWIRVAEGKFILLHRYVWEQHYGPIPPNHNVRFKDGDAMNCSIENLFLVSKTKNMDMNRNYPKMSSTMSELWHKEKLRTKYGLPRQTKLRIAI